MEVLSPKHSNPITILTSNFLPPTLKPLHLKTINKDIKNPKNLTISSSSLKIIRNPSLDRHVVKQNKIRFVQKLKTLLLSKPKHYIHLHILSKCRSYLSLPNPRSLLSMIHRYPSIFELFTIPTPPSALTTNNSQLCVRLTPAAAALATQESHFKSAISATLASKLQKLLMLSSHRRLLLSKLVHLGPDLGLPPNFRSRLCNDHSDRFKTVDTSYGRALELVSWDPRLAVPIPAPEFRPPGLIVDRPLKFKRLRLRKGLNLKRRHQEFLMKFGELPEVSPYDTPVGELASESVEAEKRACGVVREVLGMTVEKRTLVDHLTHFRKEFGLSNKVRAMLVRHPELFYVSVKGQRDSVFLTEGYDDKGGLLEKDELLVAKERVFSCGHLCVDSIVDLFLTRNSPSDVGFRSQQYIAGSTITINKSQASSPVRTGRETHPDLNCQAQDPSSSLFKGVPSNREIWNRPVYSGGQEEKGCRLKFAKAVVSHSYVSMGQVLCNYDYGGRSMNRNLWRNENDRVDVSLMDCLFPEVTTGNKMSNTFSDRYEDDELSDRMMNLATTEIIQRCRMSTADVPANADAKVSCEVGPEDKTRIQSRCLKRRNFGKAALDLICGLFMLFALMLLLWIDDEEVVNGSSWERVIDCA
ncbi:hypothetical protein HHK36_006663 [Tetracentron sinense]|uniref:PORR domain-containing protein n=1 Tax=Tetracentron sinense TaxID=13715 RepID=A0A834ZHV8_TETSI|nr:hypothetical protein HHK36_006663 [Tetracentron sinense]